ncbi:MAG: tetratricopeptide repeat protein [Candidatus Methanoplasma sp.]|jgi:tetratricopeptide (TPR) repeat protein|nr:tetratricopeptide repeat protein [Candidatus Methanoplasma sp.]
MMREPVFRDSFEVSVWRRLTSGKDSASKSNDFYINMANSVIKREGTTNSAILSLLIEKLFETQSNGMQILTEQLVSKSRPNDCTPALTASFVYADTGRWDKAEEMVESVKHAQNIPMLGCARAKIAIGAGDPSKAKKELMRARCSDPAFPMFYELIQQVEPAEGWMYRQNIELLASGREPIPFGDNTGTNSARKLYEIYRDWYRGRRDEATEAMIKSEEYQKKNAEYVLASARMSMDERDWHSAQMMYTALLTKSANCVYIICEAAKAFYSGGNYEKALVLYRDAEALDPVSPATMRGLIQTYSALGMKAEASQCVKEYLDSEGADLKAYVSGAKTLLSNSYYSDAESVVDRVLLSYPGDPSAFILKSEIDYESGNINASLRTIMNGIDKNPDNADVKLQKAKVLFKTGRTDKAVVELEKAEKVDQNNVGVLLLMMEIAISKNKNEDIMRLSNRVLELDPGNIDAMNALSRATLSVKRDDSYTSYKDMMVADNRAENFVNILSSMILDGNYREVIQMFTEKEREFGRNPTAKRLKGNAEYAMGRYKEASETFAAASEMNPKDPILWHSKGMSDEARGDLEHAEEAYNKAVLLNMNEPEYWISRSSVQEKKKDPAGAVDSLNRAIELRPGDVYALVKKGMIFAELGRLAEASYFIDMAAIIEPDNIDVLRIQRDVKAAYGNIGEAEAAAMRIISMMPSDEEGVSAAVRILMLRDKYDTAVVTVEKALKAAPGSIPLLLTKKELHSSKGNHREVIDVCRRILSVQPDNEIVRGDLAEAYSAVGDVNAASRLYIELGPGENAAEQKYIGAPKIQKQKVPESVKRYAERVLRRAYISKLTLRDPDLTASLDIDEAATKAVMSYLSDISEYGDISPGTLEFERMEKLSLSAVTKGNCTGLESDPLISIPCAYVAGGAKDADEAKLLVAYVYKALSSRKSAKTLAPELKKIAESTKKDTPIEDIMKTSKIGVYQAKLVKDSL